MSEHTLPTPDGALIWYELRGEGPLVPLVFLDGLGCEGFIWKYLWKPCTEERQVVHFNYRGHGRSLAPPDDSNVGLTYCCQDLELVLDAVGFDQVVLVGHSMGVQVALESCRRLGARVQGLILICGAYERPLDTWHGHSRMRTVFPFLHALVEGAPRAAQLFSKVLFRSRFAEEFGLRFELNRELIAPEDFRPYLEHLAKIDPRIFARTLASIVDDSAAPYLSELGAKALVIAGERDRFSPPQLSEELAKRLPSATYVLVPGGTHTAPLERPNFVEKAVLKFLAALPPHSGNLRRKPSSSSTSAAPNRRKSSPRTAS